MTMSTSKLSQMVS